MATPSAQRITELLTPVVEGTGHVLEKVTVTPAGRQRLVRAVVDLPDDATGSLSMDAVADVSRAISTALDEADAFGDAPYTLEVTSPGVSRPLTEPRHWRRARGRLVTVEVAGRGPVTGRVLSAAEVGVVLGTGAAQADELEVAWDDLGRGAVQVEFSRPGGSAGQDGEDADDQDLGEDLDADDDAQDEDIEDTSDHDGAEE